MTPEGLVYALIWSDSARSLIELVLGFAVAGMLCSGYQLMTLQPASFRLLLTGPGSSWAFVAMAFLLFAAPFIIVRNTIRGARIEGRSFGLAAMAGFLACFWSLMSGTMVATSLQVLSRIVA